MSLLTIVLSNIIAVLFVIVMIYRNFNEKIMWFFVIIIVLLFIYSIYRTVQWVRGKKIYYKQTRKQQYIGIRIATIAILSYVIYYLI